VPRYHPISVMMGLRKTPKVNPRTGPLQTNKPVTAPTTTHQGLVNLTPHGVVLLALLPSASRSAYIGPSGRPDRFVHMPRVPAVLDGRPDRGTQRITTIRFFDKRETLVDHLRSVLTVAGR